MRKEKLQAYLIGTAACRLPGLSRPASLCLLCTLLMAGCGDGSSGEASGGASPLPSEPYRVEIVGEGKQWTAQFVWPGDGPTETIRVISGKELHLPADIPVVLELRSRDYVYTFAIPEHQLKELAVPRLELELLVPTDGNREMTIVSEPLCGDPHSEVIGRIIVESPEKFWRWLLAQPVQSVQPLPLEPRETATPK